LNGLRKRLPVSTTASAVKRFKVSPDNYEHKVVLNAGDKILATLWLGDSPGLRQVHGRANEENEVYSLDFAVYEASTEPNQWTDKTVLNLKTDDITQISFPDLRLVRVRAKDPAHNGDKEAKNQDSDPKNDQSADKPTTWQVDGLLAGEETKTKEIETLVGRLANLSFESVLGQENQAEYRQEAPILKLSVTTKAGEQRDYVFSAPEKEVKPESGKEGKSEKGKESAKVTEYILKTSSSPYYFKLSEFMVKDLLEAKRDKLVKKPVEVVTPASQVTVQPEEPKAPESEGTPQIPSEATPSEATPTSP
jgi:hypothetical protein